MNTTEKLVARRDQRKDEMEEYRHVMYASSHHIRQIYSEKFGDISQIDIGSTESMSTSVEGKLGALLASLKGDVTGEITRGKIRSINFDDELFQVKQVVNDLLEDENLPDVSELSGTDGSQTGLYKFSAEFATEAEEGEFDDQTYIKLTGYEGDVKFRGTTSFENWGSRSHLNNAVDTYDTYPFDGVLTPVSKEYEAPDREEFVVQFLVILAPSQEARMKWHNRQNLKKDLNNE